MNDFNYCCPLNHKILVFKRLAVVHITGSEQEIQELSTFVTYQMKLEFEGQPMEHLPPCAIPLNVLLIL